MADLMVLAFETETGAGEVSGKVGELQKQQIIEIEDAAVVIRRQDGKVKVKQANSLVGAGALGGAFWGMLIGLIFLAPVLGLAVGALSGALAGHFTDIGIDDKFIKQVGSTINPGQSALFLMVRKITLDKFMDELKPYKFQVLQTSMSAEDEGKLKAAFGAHDVEA
jgi:uncharacterized membrane protein